MSEPAQFSFGDPEPVALQHLADYEGVLLDPMSQYYHPPVPMAALVRMSRANAHHGSCVGFKANMLGRFFKAGRHLPMQDFKAAATDFVTTGNAYLQVFRNRLGTITRLGHLQALNMRAGPDDTYRMLTGFNRPDIEFRPGEVLHIRQYDALQQIYGVPDWLGGLQAALLNQDATLFRRRYYANGCHLGFILYTQGAHIDDVTEEEIKQKIEASKGVGNFRSMYLNLKSGGDKAVQVIPVGHEPQRDDFLRIKQVSADDVIVAHRVPPALAGVKPDNVGGFGDIEKIARIYIQNELIPLAQPFEHLNLDLPASMCLVFDWPDPLIKKSEQSLNN